MPQRRWDVVSNCFRKWLMMRDELNAELRCQSQCLSDPTKGVG